jgi:gliding motility-associated-like protein
MKRITILMKSSLCLLVLTLLLLNSNTAKASHAAGGELLYEYVSGSTYKIIAKFYRDCNGINEPASLSGCYWDTCNNVYNTLTIPKSTQNLSNGQVVVMPCTGQTLMTTCNGGSEPGFREWVYETTVTLPNQCGLWTFAIQESARNGSLNINCTGNFYIQAKLNNLMAQGNSSPNFTVKPVPYVCINVPYNYNNGARDVNNDSLVFSMVWPKTNSACNSGQDCGPNAPAAGFPNYNITSNPLQTSNTFSIDPDVGILSFTPTGLTGNHTICTQVDEYRNGIWIGSVVRDIQVQYRPCTIPQPKLNLNPTTLIGGAQQNGRIEACPNVNLYFCFEAKISDSLIDLELSDNANTFTRSSSSITYYNMRTDSVTGCFSWTPTAADTGLKILVVTVQACSPTSNTPPITQAYTIPIYIWPSTEAYKDTAICMGEEVKLYAMGGGNFEWSVMPGGSGSGSLSCTQCDTAYVTPTVTTSYIVKSTLSNYCNRNVDTVTVDVLVPARINVVSDTTVCINNNYQINLNLDADPGVTYDILWSPNINISNPRDSSPIFSPTQDRTYTVAVKPSTVSNCFAYDTINFKVLQGFMLQTGDQPLCEGDSIVVDATGDARYSYEWTPKIGVSTPYSLTTTIFPDSTRRYTVTATHPGCRDSSMYFLLEVEPNPILNVGEDRLICLGDTIHINPIVSPASFPQYTYQWTDNSRNIMTSLTSKNAIYAGNTAGAHELELFVTTPAGCHFRDTMVVTVNTTEFLTPGPDQVICPGESIQITVAQGVASTLDWSPKIYMDDPTINAPTVNPLSTTEYRVIGTDMNGCKDTVFVMVEVENASFLSLPDTVKLYPGESYQMDPRGNAVYYMWSPAVGLSSTNIANPIANPEVSTKYYVTVRSEAGCETSDSIVIIRDFDSYIDVPNAFTPGNSGENNIFRPVYRGNVEVKTFDVFNRWGTKVYDGKSSGMEAGWDGRYNDEPQPMGVYIYHLEVVTPTGKTFTKTGNVTLIR